MSKVCEFCGKHPVAGHTISHSHRVVNRTFKPNIQRVTVVVDDEAVNAYLSFRNIEKVTIIGVSEANTRYLIDNGALVMTTDVCKKLEEVLA